MISMAELARALGAEVQGDADIMVARPTEPGRARADDLALAMSPRYADALTSSAARAAILWDGADWRALGLEAAICVPRARLAMSHLTQAFDTPPPVTGIHPTAVIDPSARDGAGRVG